MRFDISDWLIHFFREVDLNGRNSIVLPEHMGWGNLAEGSVLPAIYMLRCSIRQQRLWATWSFRNGRRTIYGPCPAICFTEMPLAAFLEASEIRESRREAMSQYALVFPKKALFKAGANPVIYGLDDRNANSIEKSRGGARLFDSEILPLDEQYRYVTYNPLGNHPVDWSHEREWRWPYKESIAEYEAEIEKYGVVSCFSDVPALEYTEGISGLGVIVKTQQESLLIQHDILRLVDSGLIQPETFRFILCADNLPTSSKLRSPQETSDAINESLIDLSIYFSYEEEELNELVNDFQNLVNAAALRVSDAIEGEFGGCWLWFLDNTSKLTRALLKDGRLTVNKDGRYLVELSEFSSVPALARRQEMTQWLAKDVESRFGVECGYMSVLGSQNPNSVPFYTDDHLDNKMFFNKA